MKAQVKKQKEVQRTDKKVEESLSYMVEVRDKNGRVIQRISAPSRSYVEQWNQIINTNAVNNSPTVKDTGGVVRSAIYNEIDLGVDAGIGTVTHGIRVGKGTTAVAIDDFKLESPCGEGTSTDEFEHQVVAFTEPSVAGSTCSFQIVRTFINNSGATISGVKEIGCYCKFWGDGAEKYALAFRDVLPGAVSVPDGGSITITYTIAVTV